MKINTLKGSRTFSIIFWILLGLVLCLRIYPAVTLPPHGDEGADFNTLYKDYKSVLRFFDPSVSMAADQSRLSHLVAATVIGIAGIDNIQLYKNIGVVRLVFLLIHVVYIIVSFRFVADVLKSRGAAYTYVFFLGTSCYLSSYCAAVMTTGESVFMLFHILAVWLFYTNFQNSLVGGDFRQFSFLCLITACSIAAKLFGVLLLIAFFIFHLFNLSGTRTLRITTLAPKYILSLSLGFLLVIVAINLIPFSLFAKSISALGVGILYVMAWILLAILEKRGTFAPRSIHFIYFWVLLTFCCFTLVLVFSPIYLNLQNFIDVFDYFKIWGPERINTDSSKIDAIFIMLVKFGLIPSILLVLTIAVGIGRLFKAPIERISDVFKSVYFLLFLVVFLNVILISLVHLKLPWHCISIFPFLYLPFVAFSKYANVQKSKVLKYALVALLVMVSADNLYRYIHWYPYGHFDGAQYGTANIGVNKPCLISFEVVPKFFDYFSELNQKENQNYRSVNVRGADVKILNDYLIQMLAVYFHFKGRRDVTFTSESLKKTQADLIVSSPIFTPDVESQLDADHYRKLGTISIVNISVANVWKGKDRGRS